MKGKQFLHRIAITAFIMVFLALGISISSYASSFIEYDGGETGIPLQAEDIRYYWDENWGECAETGFSYTSASVGSQMELKVKASYNKPNYNSDYFVKYDWTKSSNSVFLTQTFAGSENRYSTYNTCFMDRSAAYPIKVAVTIYNASHEQIDSDQIVVVPITPDDGARVINETNELKISRGGTKTISVETTGTTGDITCFWEWYSIEDDDEWGEIPGATSTTYTVTDYNDTDIAYWCEVRDDYGIVGWADFRFEFDNTSDETTPQARGFKHSLDYYTTKSSTTYNPELAHDLMKLAWDTYGPNTTKDSHNVGSEDDIKKDYRSLGFSGNYYSKNYSRWEYFEDYCGFSFASKESDNGGKIVVVSVRGTVGGISPTPSPEWVSDLLSPIPSINTIGWHQGFYKPACEILASLESKGLVNIGNTKYFISGHSRGAGIANVLSVLLLNKGVIKENLYDYNFACPDVRHEIASVDWTASGKFNSIFNINAANDLVGVVPGILGDTVDNMTRSASWSPWIGKLPYVWGKYGRTYFYSFDWNSNQRSVVHVWEFVHDQGSNNPHQPELYLKYLKQLNAVSSFKSYAQMKLQNVANEVKAFWAFCPVDMSLVDNNGNNIVAVINGKVKYYNNYGMDDAVVLTDGDVKAFFVNPSINCSVTLTGTGTGNMTFVSGMTKLYGQELKSEKAFTNIKLAGNKKFISEGLVSQSTNQLKLFTVNGNGKKEAEVNTNGTETKIVNTQPNTQPQLKDTQPSQQEKKEEIITSPVLNELITINYTPRKLKAKAKKKKITVSWKKIKKTKKTKTLLKQIHGIEVQYSTDPGFPVESSVKVPLGKKKTKLVLKGLQPKTQYFVRVRYTDGAGGYSNWSAVKAFRTK